MRTIEDLNWVESGPFEVCHLPDLGDGPRTLVRVPVMFRGTYGRFTVRDKSRELVRDVEAWLDRAKKSLQ